MVGHSSALSSFAEDEIICYYGGICVRDRGRAKRNSDTTSAQTYELTSATAYPLKHNCGRSSHARQKCRKNLVVILASFDSSLNAALSNKLLMVSKQSGRFQSGKFFMDSNMSAMEIHFRQYQRLDIWGTMALQTGILCFHF